MARFFSATAMGGKLYPEGLRESEGWNSAALVYYPEDVARVMVSPHPHDRLVSSAEELQLIVRTSALPAVRVWINDDLEDTARQIWEEQRGR